MERELKKFSEYSTTNPKDVSNFIKNFIKDLQDKYNNLMKIDKVNLKLNLSIFNSFQKHKIKLKRFD